MGRGLGRVCAPCACVCTGQVKILSVAIVLFLSITGAQFFFALYAHSNALLVDCASMLVDTLTYVGNLWAACRAGADDDDDGGEKARDGGEKARDTLAMSCVSIVVLYAITAWGLFGAVSALLRRDAADSLDGDVVLAFGVFGVVFDGAALFAFRYWGDDDEPPSTPSDESLETGVMLQNQNSESESDSDDEDDAPDVAAVGRSADEMNMCSAYSHVIADVIRSVTSIALGLAVILDPSLNGSTRDAGPREPRVTCTSPLWSVWATDQHECVSRDTHPLSSIKTVEERW